MPEAVTSNVRTMETKGAAAKGGIQSLERAAAILGVIAASAGKGVALREVSAQTGLHTSTAFHLLKTLETLGFAARNGDSKEYYIGPRLFALAAVASPIQTLVRISQPVLDTLSAETGETSHLGIRSGNDILLVARAAARGMLQMADVVGKPRPAHATAIGKLLLAYSDPAVRDGIIETLTFESFTPSTITTVSDLLSDLARILERGYAEGLGELDSNVLGIAMPVRNYSGNVVAAIGLAGPVWNMQPDRVEKHLVALRTRADELSMLLGHSTGAWKP